MMVTNWTRTALGPWRFLARVQRFWNARLPKAGTDDQVCRKCLLLLDLPRQSQSLQECCYTATVGDEQALRWVVRRLQKLTNPQADVLISVAVDERAAATAALAGMTRVHIGSTAGPGELRALKSLPCMQGVSRVLWVDMTASLLPRDVIDALTTAHVARRAHLTRAIGLPCANPPVMIEAWLLARISRLLPAGADFRSSLAVCQRLARLLSVRHLAVVNESEQDRRGWPYALQLETPEEITVLRELIRRNGSDPDDRLDLLAAWTEAAHHVARARLQEQRRPSTSTQHEGVRHAGPVLLVSVPSAFSGGEQSLIVLARALRERYDGAWPLAALVALPGVFADRLVTAGVTTVVAGRHLAEPEVTNYLYARAILHRFRPRLVHANSVLGVPFSCAIESLGIPLVQHVRVANEHLFALADQLKTAAAIIAVSGYVRSRIVRLGVDPDKVHVVHNGMLAQFPESLDRADLTLRRAHGIPDHASVLLTVARYARNKRHDVVVGALARLVRRKKNVHLLLVGEALGPGAQILMDELRRQVSKRRLEDRVHFLGFRFDMREAYAAADVIAFPSEDDPFPRALLEGMAAQVPIVAARSGGTPEMLTHGDSGLLVAPGDVVAFADALERILDEADLRANMVANAFGRCFGEFSAIRCAERTADVYARVTAAHSAETRLAHA
jgi:glycosyltransferase involved in cell wall biosynthesis